MKRPNVDKARQLRKNQTDAERKLWAFLRNRQVLAVKFRRQFPLEKFILDFYSPEVKLCVECDGGQHYDEEGQAYDDVRTRKLLDLGVRVIRFSNRDVLTNFEGVCEVIIQAVKETSDHPLTSFLSPGGEEDIRDIV